MDERLKKARLNAGYSSAAKAAEALGVRESTYRGHENGQNKFDFSDAERYAKKYKCNAIWLLTGQQSDKKDSSEITDNEPTAAISDYDALNTSIPEYDVYVSAGGGAIVEHENVKSQWPFNLSYLQNELRVSPKDLALVEVRGDSMEPTLSSGDRVMIDTTDRNVSQPGIFVLWDGDGTVIKRLERVYDSEENTIALISDNKRHSRYEIPAHSDRIKIVGRVIWCAKRL